MNKFVKISIIILSVFFFICIAYILFARRLYVDNRSPYGGISISVTETGLYLSIRNSLGQATPVEYITIKCNGEPVLFNIEPMVYRNQSTNNIVMACEFIEPIETGEYTVQYPTNITNSVLYNNFSFNVENKIIPLGTFYIIVLDTVFDSTLY